jgi:WD40 repeat protein
LRTFTVSKLWRTVRTSPAEPLVMSRDGRFAYFLYSLGSDGSGPAYVEEWRLDHGGRSRLIRIGSAGMIAATALPGDRLVIATYRQILTWNARTGKVESVPGPTFAPTEYVNGAISPNGRLLAYGLGDGTVHFFDIANGKTVDGLAAHSAAVQRIAFSPDSQTAVSTGDDGIAIVWNPITGQPIERLTGHTGRVLGADFSPDGKTLYTAGLDGTILQYDLGGTRRFGSPFRLAQSYEPAGRLSALPSTPLLAISPDSRFFAASAVIDPNGNSASPVELYSVSPLRRVGAISLPKARLVGGGAFAGSRFVVGADHGLVQFWPVTDGHARPGPSLHGFSAKSQVRALATADGGRIVAGVDGWYGPPPKEPERGELAIWRDGGLVSGKVIKLSGFGNAVALSADGSTVAVSADALPGHPVQVLIVDARTGTVERAITVPHASGSVTALAFAPDGTLATGNWSGIVNLWNPKTGAGIGHPTLVAPAPVASISFSRDGKSFATSGASSGGTSIWETATQQQLGSDFPGGEGQWGNVAYTPDGRYLMSVFGDGTAFRWPVAVDAWENQACAVAGRNFTSEEWRRFVGSGRSRSATCPQYPLPKD